MDINKLTIQERFYIFLALFCVGMMFMNYYFHNQIDKDIQQKLEEMNKTSQENFTANTISRSMAIEHWKSMYNGQKSYNVMLEDQIDVINQYWKTELVELNDQLFDLRYGTNAISK